MKVSYERQVKRMLHPVFQDFYASNCGVVTEGAEAK